MIYSANNDSCGRKINTITQALSQTISVKRKILMSYKKWSKNIMVGCSESSS